MTKFKLGLVVAAMAVAACGGNNDTADNNGTENNGTVNNGETNNGTANNGANNGSNNGTTANNGSNNGTTANNGANNGVVIEEPPGCSDTPAPERCANDPSSETWGPTSVVDFFFIEGTEDDPVCCYDYGGPDSEIDNSLGTNLSAFGFLEDINGSVSDSISGGSLVLLLEHYGITALDNSDPYEVNFFIGAHADETAFAADGFAATGNQVLIDPASFEQGSHPQAYLPDAELTGGALTAGPGSVKIEIELFDSPLQLTISLARTDSVIDQANSALDGGGISLQSGQLGGVVKVEDIFVAVNEFASGACSCLGLPAGEDLVDVTSGACSENADAQACEDAGESTCSEVAGACQLFSAVSLFADVDLDGDGLMDSVSIGSSYTAKGADIAGLSQ